MANEVGVKSITVDVRVELEETEFYYVRGYSSTGDVSPALMDAVNITKLFSGLVAAAEEDARKNLRKKREEKES